MVRYRKKNKCKAYNFRLNNHTKHLCYFFIHSAQCFEVATFRKSITQTLIIAYPSV